MGLESSASSEYEKVWEQARTNATRAAAAEYAGEQTQLAKFNKAWTAALNNWNTAKTNVLKARSERFDIESQYRSWQHEQYMKELTEYQNQYQSMLEKKLAAQRNELNMYLAELRAQATRRAADLEEQTQRRIAEIQQREKESNLQYSLNLMNAWKEKNFRQGGLLLKK